MKDAFGDKMMTEFAEVTPKTDSYLTDSNDGNKRAKSTKNCVIKQKLKFEYYKHCLEANQSENKINQLEKNKVDVDSPRDNHKELIKINKLMLKSQQRSRS